MEGALGDFASEFEVLFEVDGGEELFFANGVEGGDFSVLGNVVEVDFKAKKVFDGGGIFATIEAAHFDFSSMIGEAFAGGVYGAGEGIKDGGEFFVGGKLVGFEGRHIATVELVEDVLPALGGVVVGNVPSSEVEADLAFLLVGAVTLDTVFVEEGFHHAF